MSCLGSGLLSDANRGGKVRLGTLRLGGWSRPLLLSAASISDPLNREGKGEGCLKNEESNVAAEEFRPLPSGCVSVHTCLHMQARYDCSAAAATPGVEGQTLHFTFGAHFK